MIPLTAFNHLAASHVDGILCKALLHSRILESGGHNCIQLRPVVWLKDQPPSPQPASNPRQKPFWQIHGVGHCYHCKPATLSGWPLKQVVQHLQPKAVQFGRLESMLYSILMARLCNSVLWSFPGLSAHSSHSNLQALILIDC